MTRPAPEPNERPDVWPWRTTRDESGQLMIGGHSTRSLVESFGTPVYAMSIDDMCGRAQVWHSAMSEAFWDGYGMNGAMVYYAGKAFLCKRIVREMAAIGLGIDTASEGELTLALQAGIEPEKIGLHGNNKSDRLLDLAVERQIGRIVIDSLSEIGRVNDAAVRQGRRARVMIRVTTGVHAGGHEFIATAHEDQKFGLSLAAGTAFAAARACHEASHLDFIGLHSHIGSQITSIEAFTEAARRLLGLRKELLDAGIDCPEVDLGGGYAIAYHGGDPVAPSQKTYAESLADVMRSICQEYAMDVPMVSIEPGRSIAGPSTVTLYTVGTIKDVALEDGTSRRYVSIDGGMSDNIRPALYGAAYTCARANRPNRNADGSEPTVRCRVVGSHCESGDIVIDDVALPDDLCAGDIVAVPATGAYGRVMSSNYNMLPTPAVVGLSGDEASVIVQGRSIAQLCAEDLS